MTTDVQTPAIGYAPGSEDATCQGCTCPIIDNAQGRGYMGKPGVFVMSAGCPLHGVKPDDR